MAVSVMRACRGKGKTGVSSAATWVGEALNFLQNVLNENDILDLLVSHLYVQVVFFRATVRYSNYCSP